MALYKPDKSKIDLPKDGFKVDSGPLQQLMKKVGTGEVVNVPRSEMSSILPGLSQNPNLEYFAASGVECSHDYGGAFQQGQPLLCVEAVRRELNQQEGEPPFNMNRLVLGTAAANESSYGIDVTTWKSNSETGQVGDHWDNFDDYRERYFKIDEGKSE
jgi:hypothetical protein